MPENQIDNNILKIDVAAWVEKAKNDPINYLQRQAIEITLNAIAMQEDLNQKLYLKGGILMGLAYNSPRQTSDIDLTTSFDANDEIANKIKALLDKSLPRAAANLGYINLILKVHSVKEQPKNIFTQAQFPALQFKIAFAQRNTKQEEALKKGKAPNIIDIDISFNEPLNSFQIMKLTGGEEIFAYSLIDLIAEKYRAILQQKSRNRNRRQDIYDIERLIKQYDFDNKNKEKLLETIIEKCNSRGIDPLKNSLDDGEIKSRSASDWHTLALEIYELPDFENCYKSVNDFYKSLNW